MTPQELARELGISPATLRSWLRRRYPRPGGERGRWYLTDEQVSAARARWPQRPYRRQPRERPKPAIAPLYSAHSRRSRRHKPRLPHRLTAAVGILAVVAAVLVSVGYTGVAALRSSCNLAAARPIKLGQNSFVYASNGARLGMVPAVRVRDPVALASMSPWLPKATVAIEDRRFWHHGALDYRAIARAAIADISPAQLSPARSSRQDQSACASEPSSKRRIARTSGPSPLQSCR